MMEVTGLEFNDNGKLVFAKGRFKRSKIFSITTDIILYWADLELDYMGGFSLSNLDGRC